MTQREPTGAPSLRFELTFVLASAALALLTVWARADLAAWLEPEPATVHALALDEERAREAENARRFAAALAACLNGQSITDGERVIACKEVR